MTYNVDGDEGAQALDHNEALDRYQFAVAEGCAVSINSGTLSQTDTLSVAAGEVLFDGDLVSVAAQDVGIGGADVNAPRKDVVYVDGNGDAQVAPGTPEAAVPDTKTRFETWDPSPKDLSATAAVVLAEVWVPAGASSITSSDLRDRRVLADLSAASLTSNVWRDQGRYEMIHLTTFNVGGDQKQAEVNLTISDYTDKGINKILLQCEHLSVHDEDGAGDYTFAVQYNSYSDSSGYINYKMDGTYTEDAHAILAKQAPNNRPFLGRVWFHVDNTFQMWGEGGVLTYTPLDHVYSHTAAFNPNGGSPATFDSLRFFTPDGDQIRMRRATVLGFSEGQNG